MIVWKSFLRLAWRIALCDSIFPPSSPNTCIPNTHNLRKMHRWGENVRCSTRGGYTVLSIGITTLLHSTWPYTPCWYFLYFPQYNRRLKNKAGVSLVFLSLFSRILSKEGTSIERVPHSSLGCKNSGSTYVNCNGTSSKQSWHRAV